MKQRFFEVFHKILYFSKQHKRAINVTVQVVVSAVLIYQLLRLIDIPEMVILFSNVNAFYFILLLALITFDRIFMAYKWHFLLKVKDRSISFLTVIKTYYIGTFIGFFLPATIGGDIVRVVKLRSDKHKGSDIMYYVILERMLGFAASAILATVTALFLIFLFKLKIWIFLLIAGAILVLFIILILFSFNRLVINKIDRNERLAGNFIFSRLKKIYVSYADYKNHKGLLVLFLVLSILEQMVPVVANYLMGLMLNLDIPLMYFLLVIPLVQLISRIPVSFEGIGINEGLMVYFFGLLGLSKTGAFSIGLLGHIAVIFATLPGLYFYFRDFRTLISKKNNKDII